MVLVADPSNGELREDRPDDTFYRTYMGGGLALDHILKMVPPGADPLGPDNVLVLSTGVFTGTPISGQSRVVASARSPLTGSATDGVCMNEQVFLQARQRYYAMPGWTED